MEKKHTRLSNKHFLRCAAGTLPHSVVHTETDLVAFVFTQICEERTHNRTVKDKRAKKKLPQRDRTVTVMPVARQHHKLNKKTEGGNYKAKW